MSDSKHTSYDLSQMQSLPLEAKIIMTKNRIREWYEHFDGMVYVSFSGGKDSTVLKHIVDSMYDDVPAVFVNTGLEYPEIQRFVREIKNGKYDCFNSNVEVLRPKMRFDEVIERVGYPIVGKKQAEAIELARKNIKNGIYSFRCMELGISTKDATKMGMKLPSNEILARYDKTMKGSKYNFKKWNYLIDSPFKISAKCCDIMKKKPAFEYQKKTGRRPYLGTMATESMMRKSAWMQHGCNAFNATHPSSQPLSFWTEQDVLHYIQKFNVSYASVYGDIVVDNGAKELDGQINVVDYLRCYNENDKLKTTGADRTGCMFCMFGVHLQKEPNRFQQMKVTHPKQYEYCMNKLGLKEVLEYIGVKYE